MKLNEQIKQDGATQTDYFVHTNSIGSVTAITDQDGNLVERVSYDTFGMPTFTDCQTDPLNPTVVSDSLIGNDILFQGRRYDEETNLYYYRARYYDPIMGRFLQTDPMGYADSMNLYQAFNMNPFNFLDPLGLAIIVLDPGHGDVYDKWLDSGATGIGGKKPHEKDFALDLAKAIGKELKKLGHTVYYTRTGDMKKKQQRWKWRAKISDAKNADFFISIHLNSFDKKKNYFMVAYKSKKGKKLADSIAEKVKQKGFSSSIAEKHSYKVLRYTEAIAVLIEAGNIKNPNNKKIITDEKFIKQVVKGTDEAAKDYEQEKQKKLLNEMRKFDREKLDTLVKAISVQIDSMVKKLK